MKAKILLISIFILGSLFQSFAQYKNEEELIKEANRMFENDQFTEAFESFQTLLSNHKENADYNYKYAVCLMYSDRRDKTKPIIYLKKAISDPTIDILAHYFLGLAYQQNYQFTDAKKEYLLYKELAKNNAIERYHINRRLEECDNAMSLLKNIAHLYVIMNKEVKDNSFYRDYTSLNSGGQIIIKPEELRTKLDKKDDRDRLAYFLPKSNTILFSSRGDKGENGLDIYRSRRTPEGSWTKPENLGSIINTPYNDAFPFLSVDGLTLFFSSEGHNSIGGYDIFQSKFDLTSFSWSEPKNLDFPINTPFQELFFIPDSTGKFAYFSSDRSSVNGLIRVYNIGLNVKADKNENLAYLLLDTNTMDDGARRLKQLAELDQNIDEQEYKNISNNAPLANELTENEKLFELQNQQKVGQIAGPQDAKKAVQLIDTAFAEYKSIKSKTEVTKQNRTILNKLISDQELFASQLAAANNEKSQKQLASVEKSIEIAKSVSAELQNQIQIGEKLSNTALLLAISMQNYYTNDKYDSLGIASSKAQQIYTQYDTIPDATNPIFSMQQQQITEKREVASNAYALVVESEKTIQKLEKEKNEYIAEAQNIADVTEKQEYLDLANAMDAKVVEAKKTKEVYEQEWQKLRNSSDSLSDYFNQVNSVLTAYIKEIGAADNSMQLAKVDEIVEKNKITLTEKEAPLNVNPENIVAVPFENQENAKLISKIDTSKTNTEIAKNENSNPVVIVETPVVSNQQTEVEKTETEKAEIAKSEMTNPVVVVETPVVNNQQTEVEKTEAEKAEIAKNEISNPLVVAETPVVNNQQTEVEKTEAEKAEIAKSEISNPLVVAETPVVNNQQTEVEKTEAEKAEIAKSEISNPLVVAETPVVNNQQTEVEKTEAEKAEIAKNEITNPVVVVETPVVNNQQTEAVKTEAEKAEIVKSEITNPLVVAETPVVNNQQIEVEKTEAEKAEIAKNEISNPVVVVETPVVNNQQTEAEKTEVEKAEIAKNEISNPVVVVETPVVNNQQTEAEKTEAEKSEIAKNEIIDWSLEPEGIELIEKSDAAMETMLDKQQELTKQEQWLNYYGSKKIAEAENLSNEIGETTKLLADANISESQKLDLQDKLLSRKEELKLTIAEINQAKEFQKVISLQNEQLSEQINLSYLMKDSVESLLENGTFELAKNLSLDFSEFSKTAINEEKNEYSSEFNQLNSLSKSELNTMDSLTVYPEIQEVEIGAEIIAAAESTNEVKSEKEKYLVYDANQKLAIPEFSQPKQVEAATEYLVPIQKDLEKLEQVKAENSTTKNAINHQVELYLDKAEASRKQANKIYDNELKGEKVEANNPRLQEVKSLLKQANEFEQAAVELVAFNEILKKNEALASQNIETSKQNFVEIAQKIDTSGFEKLTKNSVQIEKMEISTLTVEQAKQDFTKDLSSDLSAVNENISKKEVELAKINKKSSSYEKKSNQKLIESRLEENTDKKMNLLEEAKENFELAIALNEKKEAVENEIVALKEESKTIENKINRVNEQVDEMVVMAKSTEAALSQTQDYSVDSLQSAIKLNVNEDLNAELALENETSTAKEPKKSFENNFADIQYMNDADLLQLKKILLLNQIELSMEQILLLNKLLMEIENTDQRELIGLQIAKLENLSDSAQNQMSINDESLNNLAKKGLKPSDLSLISPAQIVDTLNTLAQLAFNESKVLKNASENQNRRVKKQAVKKSDELNKQALSMLETAYLINQIESKNALILVENRQFTFDTISSIEMKAKLSELNNSVIIANEKANFYRASALENTISEEQRLSYLNQAKNYEFAALQTQKLIEQQLLNYHDSIVYAQVQQKFQDSVKQISLVTPTENVVIEIDTNKVVAEANLNSGKSDLVTIFTMDVVKLSAQERSTVELQRSEIIGAKIDDNLNVAKRVSYYNENRPIPVDRELPKGLIFKVQVAAFKNFVPNTSFKGINPIVAETNPNSAYVRYMSGLFVDFESAAISRDKIRTTGFTDAFVVAYFNGERISILKARELIAQGIAFTDPNLVPVATIVNQQTYVANTAVDTNKAKIVLVNGIPASNLNEFEVFFTVQVGVYVKPRTKEQLPMVSEINFDRLANGNYRYYSKKYLKLADAQAERDKIRAAGVTDAFVVAYSKGVRVGVAQAQKLIVP